MIPFEYRRAADPHHAVASVEGRPDAVYLGGGTNIVDHMKLGVVRPGLVVDVSGLALNGVGWSGQGTVRIGATARNHAVAADPIVRAHLPIVSRALLSGASGQIRNMATTAGNLLQRTRCPYFRDVTMACNKRVPGQGCAAIGGYNRYHAILGASEDCVAVHPSDLAVGLTALNAVVEVLGPRGQRRIPLTAFYRPGPGDAGGDTVLEHGELITSVEVAALPPGTRSEYRKVRDRASFAFALVSVAAAVRVENGVVVDVRLALGGVAPRPWRARRAEALLTGRAPDRASFRAALCAELATANPMADNSFKVPLAVKLAVSVLDELTGDHAT